MTAEDALKKIYSMAIAGDEFLDIYRSIEHISAVVKCAYSYADNVNCENNENREAWNTIQTSLKVIENLSSETESNVNKCVKALIELSCLDK